MLQLWQQVDSSIKVAHMFEGYPTHCVKWHSQIAEDGTMLLARQGK